ncbi:MAG: hypothetical protein Kow0090_03200 [Myxococcota bacterium]
MRHYVYLIPGFFGFDTLGGVAYFRHLKELLTTLIEGAGRNIEIHTVPTLPTASIRRRALLLLDKIAASARDESASIHLIGHSTGGLDARLLATPYSDITGDARHTELAGRIRNVFCISTPHRGTPLASFFTGLMGKKLLYLVSWFSLYTIKYGNLPLNIAAKFVGAVTKLDGQLGLENTILDDFYNQLFSDLSTERRMELKKMMAEILVDQSLLIQLTPDGMDVFNAAAPDNPQINYYCVTTMCEKPSFASLKNVRLNPYSLAAFSLFNILYRLSSPAASSHHYSWSPDKSALEIFDKAYGRTPEWNDNDGIVPTRSQLRGKLLYAAKGDHLDSIGHYDSGADDPLHINWLSSGAGFDKSQFYAIWSKVAEKIVAD